MSNHSKKKAAIIKNLVESTTLLSHPSFHENFCLVIRHFLLLNNYLLNFINFHIDNRIWYNLNKNNNFYNNNTDINEVKKFVSIPYHENISFTIKRILSDYNLESVFRVDSKLDNMMKLGIIYKLIRLLVNNAKEYT